MLIRVYIVFILAAMTHGLPVAFGPETEADAEVQRIVSEVEPEIKQSFTSFGPFDEFVARKYVVQGFQHGNNYIISIDIGGGRMIVIKVSKAFSETALPVLKNVSVYSGGPLSLYIFL